MLSRSQVKYIQSLSHKKFRDEAGAFVIEGPKMVEEFLNLAPSSINAVYAIEPWLEGQKDLDHILSPDSIHPVSSGELERISFLTTPNQVLAVVRQFEQVPADFPLSGLMLALDGIQDPGNLGTIIRTADWFGVTRIYCSRESADLYNPKVVQSTMGSIIRVPVHYVALEKLFEKTGSVPIIAAALEGENLFHASRLNTALIVVGNESKGISQSLLEKAHRKITIPRFGGAESLNAAVAAAIMLSYLRK
jgi:TrmH family RNA methyltransferase